MNVIILTPDRVGSTLLQRVITVYMQLHDYGQPVINLHELTNGLMSYYNEDFRAEVLGKPENWGYFQTLPEIVQLLKQVPHYKTSRLAQYHIRRRKDSIADQLDFYKYINENFYVIAAQRQDLFEHALSWCIYAHTKQLNVYSHQDKFSHFATLYRNPIRIERESLIKHLSDYLEYQSWVSDYFNVQSYFEYERHVKNLEQYVLELPLWPNQRAITWQQTFDIDWTDYNRCHYLLSDMSNLSRQLGYVDNRVYSPGETLPKTGSITTRDVVASLSTQDQRFLSQQATSYVRTQERIRELIDRKVLVTGIPIKLQTLAEKAGVIENYDEALTWYTEWADQHGIAPRDNSQRKKLEELINYHAVKFLPDDPGMDVVLP